MAVFVRGIVERTPSISSSNPDPEPPQNALVEPAPAPTSPAPPVRSEEPEPEVWAAANTGAANVTMSDLLDQSWLDLVPVELLPDGYRAALNAELKSGERAAAVSEALERAEGMLRRELASSHDPLTMLPVATELTSLKAIAECMPSPIGVPHAMHEALAQRLYMALGVESLSLGRPPAPFAERVHFAQYHKGYPDPLVTDEEQALMDLFVKVSEMSASRYQTMMGLKMELGPFDSIASRVRLWHEVRTTMMPDVRMSFAALREHVEQSNQRRWTSKRAHICDKQSGGRRFLLPAVPFSGHAWTPEADARNFGFVDAEEIKPRRN